LWLMKVYIGCFFTSKQSKSTCARPLHAWCTAYALHAVRALRMHYALHAVVRALRTARSACTAPAPLHAVRELRLHHCTHYAFRSAARQRATQLQHPLTARHPELSGAMHTQRAKQPLLTLASYLSSSRRRGANLVSERATRQQTMVCERERQTFNCARTHMCVCRGVSRTCVCARACQARSCF
jgi:hypothetical protein